MMEIYRTSYLEKYKKRKAILKEKHKNIPKMDGWSQILVVGWPPSRPNCQCGASGQIWSLASMWVGYWYIIGYMFPIMNGNVSKMN